MKPIRYGIIGLKGIGRAHLRLVQRDPLLQMTAVADIDAEEVKARSNALGVPGYTDYRALLDADLVDAVTLALPHHLHVEIGLACLNAGLHVLLEKPLANRVSEADALLAAAKANGVKIAVGHQGRFHRSAQAIKSLIDLGIAGQVYFRQTVTPEEIERLINRSTAIVFASAFEGLPMFALEGAQLGRPIIATRVGGMAAIVRDGETGYLVATGDEVALADAFYRLLSDQEQAQRMGAAARRLFLAQFTIEHCAAAYQQVYLEVMNS